MEGSKSAERMINTAEKYLAITKENYNRAYSLCMKIPVVFANKSEEDKYVINHLRSNGFMYKSDRKTELFK